MRLPPDAFVDLMKLEDYCLCPTHPEGKHKARVFQSALGITAADAVWLQDEILAAALREECNPGRNSAHGQRYTVDFSVRRNSSEARIRSAWIVRSGETFPRLSSCYVL